MKKIVVLLLSYIFLYTSAFASMCEVKSFEEFFAKNLDIIVPSDSDNTPNSIRIKKSIFHYFIVGRDLPVEFLNNDKPIKLGADEIKKYIWGVSKRTIGHQIIDVQNCMSISTLSDLQSKFKVWRKENLGGLSNAIHELDLVGIVRAIVDKDYYSKNGDFDYRSLRLLMMAWDEAAANILSSDFKISKSIESFLVEIAIEQDSQRLLDLLIKKKVNFRMILYNGLTPLGYSLLLAKSNVLPSLYSNGVSLCEVDSYGNSNGAYVVIDDQINNVENPKGFNLDYFRLWKDPDCREYIFKKMPSGLNWTTYYWFKYYQREFLKHNIVIPDNAAREFESHPDYLRTKKIAEELDKRTSPDNILKNNLTSSEFAWRMFVEDAYLILSPASFKFHNLDQKNSEFPNFLKLLMKAEKEPYVEEPKSRKKICEKEIYDEMVLKYGFKPSLQSRKCPGFNLHPKTIQQRLLDEGVVQSRLLYSGYYLGDITHSLSDKERLQLFKQIKITALENHSNYLWSFLDQKLKETNKYILDTRDHVEFAITHNLIGNISSVETYIKELELNRDVLLRFKKDLKKWDRLAQHSKLFVLKSLKDIPERFKASGPLLLSSQTVNFVNGVPYYICGKYGDIYAEDSSGKKSLNIIPFCLKNIEGLKQDDGQDLEGDHEYVPTKYSGTTNLLHVLVYNIGNKRLALVPERVSPYVTNYIPHNLFDRIKREQVIPSLSSFENVVFVNEEDVTTPTVLTDGKFTLALPGFNVSKVFLSKSSFSVEAKRPCEMYSRLTPSKIEFLEKPLDSYLNAKLWLPVNFENTNAKVVDNLPIDQPSRSACDLD